MVGFCVGIYNNRAILMRSCRYIERKFIISSLQLKNMYIINHVAWKELTVPQLWRPARIVPENYKPFIDHVR